MEAHKTDYSVVRAGTWSGYRSESWPCRPAVVPWW